MTESDASLMLAAHICWLNRRENEFLSWTSSLLSLLAHIILRHEKGQKDIFIAFGNTRKLQTPTAGEQASFYPTVSLLRMLPQADLAELTALTMRKLHHRHYTHESVSFGEMRDPDRAIIHVLFEELVRNGLLEIMPELCVSDLFPEPTGLY